MSELIVIYTESSEKIQAQATIQHLFAFCVANRFTRQALEMRTKRQIHPLNAIGAINKNTMCMFCNERSVYVQAVGENIFGLHYHDFLQHASKVFFIPASDAKIHYPSRCPVNYIHYPTFVLFIAAEQTQFVGFINLICFVIHRAHGVLRYSDNDSLNP